MSDDSVWIESLSDDVLEHVVAAAEADYRSAQKNLAAAQDHMDRVADYARAIQRELTKRELRRERAS